MASAIIHWHGIGGRTVAKTIMYDLQVVTFFQPDIVILQLGSNDLTAHDPLHVGSAIDDFVRLLHVTYGVRLIYICQTLRSEADTRFNRNVNVLTQYLRVIKEFIPYAHFWGHRGFWNAVHNFYARDGIHLDRGGQFKFYRRIRGVIFRSLRLLSSTHC